MGSAIYCDMIMALVAHNSPRLNVLNNVTNLFLLYYSVYKLHIYCFIQGTANYWAHGYLKTKYGLWPGGPTAGVTYVACKCDEPFCLFLCVFVGHYASAHGTSALGHKAWDYLGIIVWTMPRGAVNVWITIETIFLPSPSFPPIPTLIFIDLQDMCNCKC